MSAGKKVATQKKKHQPKRKNRRLTGGGKKKKKDICHLKRAEGLRWGQRVLPIKEGVFE